MKKLVLSICLFFAVQAISNAQQTMDDMLQQMFDMQKQMIEQFSNLDSNSYHVEFFFDTLITGDGGHIEFNFGDSFFEPMDPQMMEDMFEQLEEQLGEIDTRQFEDLEKMFEQFEQLGPFFQFQIPQTEGDSIQPADKKKKKYKTFKI